MTTSDASSPNVFTNMQDYLATVEDARRRQLDALPSRNLDPVAAAHRAAVEQIVDEVVTARHRLTAGLYGVCTGCEEPIATERLEFRPWATTCIKCSQR
jgi:RNA polymerase-binding transcription factor DksA